MVGESQLCRFSVPQQVGFQGLELQVQALTTTHPASSVAYDKEWSNLGDWDAIWRQSETDIDGDTTSQNAMAIDCTKTLLRSDARDLEVVGIGLTNIVAIAMNDATHRLENPGKVAVVLIEVQTGSYLGEADIIRYEDLYARTSDDDTDAQP